MNKSVLLDIFVQARLRATRRDQLMSHQRSVITSLEKEGVDSAEGKKFLSTLADAREKDLAEMDWALDELDKTQASAVR
jgi:hypothetical protein